MSTDVAAMGLGETYSIAAAATWALGVIGYAKLGRSLAPQRLNWLKNLLVLAMLVPATLWFDGVVAPALSPLQMLVCALSGLIGIGIADTIYFRSLNALGPGHMGVLGNLYSPLMIVLSFVFLGERLNLQQLLGFALVSAGVIVVSSSGAGTVPARGQLRHVLHAAASILLMAGSVIMVKRILETHSVWWVSSLRVAGGVAGLWLIGIGGARAGDAASKAPLPWRRWMLLLLAAFVGQFLSMLFWLNGYKYTSASVAAILNETASIFIVLFAWLLLGETVSRRRLLGTAMAIAGVALMLW
ncbi:MAG: DMT family transporter [Lysobacterales bacterium]